jgi:cytosine permease
VLNSLNLYSTMLSVESTFPRLNQRILVVLLGILGTIAAFMNVLDYFLDFLFYLSVIFVPVAGVIFVDYLIVRRSAYHENREAMEKNLRPVAVLAWATGAIFAFAGSRGWYSLSGIAAIDAMLVSGTVYFLLSRFMHLKNGSELKERTRGTNQ